MNVNFKKTALVSAILMSAAGFSTTGHAALSYFEDFESVDASLPGDKDIPGWVIGNIVNGGAGWFAGAAAPANYNNGYSRIRDDQGDVAQGTQQLAVFNDYNPWSPFTGGTGTTIQAFVYTDVGTITADMVGNTYRFSFDGKLGDIAAPSEAEAFLKVLQQSDNSFFELANLTFDSDANLTTDWGGGFIDITIDAGMVGELLQIGFNNTATDYGPSTVFYDNVSLAAVPVPAAVWLFGSGLLGLVSVARRRKS